ncbi:putative ABC transport system integral membrane protein [Frankia alni ACN14a]|uniref:ABC transport system integral membrane protein n=1 Tax=Frankia alni (strain DSM 45986 / CECT 9034 / ACN14a) TaxID=326424 RepID=Q0REU4_FRAAA|nr:putative ABC transport system integral membrane protein [Frankia alni ACN14a]
MLWLALRTLRTRRSAFLGSFVALVCTCALITACGLLFQSALTSHPPAERYRDVPLVVAGRQSLAFTYGSGDGKNTEHVALPERVRPAPGLADRLRAVPGVAEVVPDVSLPVGLATAGTEITTPDTVQLHGWDSARLTPYRLTKGRAPAGPGEVVVDADLARRARLAPGSRVTVAATDRVAGGYSVVGVAAPHSADPGPAVFVADAEANRLTAGLVDVLGVYPAPDSDSATVAKAVRRSLHGLPLSVRTGDGRGAAEFLDVDGALENVVALSATFGGISMAVALFVLAGTLALSVQQRRRELALLRAVGATGRQIRRLICGETLVLGLLACLPGLVGGAALAWVLRAVLVDHGVAPAAMRLDVGWIPLLVGAGATVLTAQLAVLVTGLRAGRLRPAQALYEATVPPARLGFARLLLGLLCAAGGIAVVATTRFLTGGVLTAIAAGAVLLHLFAAGLLGPLVARLALALLGPFIRGLSRTTGFLAVANSRAHTRRVTAVFTPLVLCTALGGTLLFLQTSRSHASEVQGRDRVLADQALTTRQGLPAGFVDTVRATPGVTAAAGLTPTTVVTGGSDSYAAQAITFAGPPGPPGTPGGTSGLLDLDVTAGSLADLRGDTVALSADRAHGKHVGRTVRLWLGDGTRRDLRLVAVYRRSIGFGDYLLPSPVVATHTTSPLIQTILVDTAPGAHIDWRALVAAQPGLHVHDRAALGSAALDGAEQQQEDLGAWSNYLLVALLTAFAAIAVVNTLTMATLERGREFATLRLTGATRRQVMRMVRWEAVLITAIALVVGAAITAATLVPFSRGISGTGTPYVPPQWVAALLGSGLLLAMAGSLLPARAVLRTPPVQSAGTGR